MNDVLRHLGHCPPPSPRAGVGKLCMANAVSKPVSIIGFVKCVSLDYRPISQTVFMLSIAINRTE